MVVGHRDHHGHRGHELLLLLCQVHRYRGTKCESFQETYEEA
jgi:hypothetical protein